jgi:hypothetical protein
LGYRPEAFQQIDRSIGRESFYREQQDRAYKVDRYGKKYSWIAYFEVAGDLEDRGELPDRFSGHRISDCDIDPSFPAALREWQPPMHALFESAYSSASAWAKDGPTPSYDHILKVSQVDGSSGPWVLLNGFIQESAPNDSREAFSFVRALFVRPSEVPRFQSSFLDIEYPGNEAIPDPGSDYYTFAGEIPWSRRYAHWLRPKRGDVRPQIVEAFETSKEVSVRKRSDRLVWWELRQFIPELGTRPFFQITTDHDDPVDSEADKRIEDAIARLPKYVYVQRFKQMPGIKIELPTYRYLWESYHSMENQIGSVDFVAPALCNTLGLRNRGNSADLVDPSGATASLYRVFGSSLRSDVLYLREDLVRKYLDETGQVIVWVVWGNGNSNTTHTKPYAMSFKVSGLSMHISIGRYLSGWKTSVISVWTPKLQFHACSK